MSPAFRKALPWPLAGNGIHHVQGGRIPIRYKPSPRLTGTTYGVGGSFFEIDFVLAGSLSLSLFPKDNIYHCVSMPYRVMRQEKRSLSSLSGGQRSNGYYETGHFMGGL